MKKLFILIIALIATATAARSEDYLDSIARKVCLEAQKFSNDENLEAKLGVTMIQACFPYRDRILKDHSIDMNKITSNDMEESRALGQLLGIRMALYCPEFFESLAGMDEENEIIEESVSGMMIAIQFDGPFPMIAVETDAKERYQLLVLEDFEGAAELIKNKEKYYKKPMNFIYTVYELFDKEKLANREYKVLKGIEVPR